MKSKLSAKEVEREMQEYRESMNFTGYTETEVIKNLVSNSKANGKVGDKILTTIPAYYIHIPEWQREISVSRALNIGNNYNPYKWEVPKVICENNRLICIDGQHRIYGAFKGDVGNVVIELLLLSEKEAIKLFIGQSKAHKTMRPTDVYKAAIVAEEPDWITFREILKANNVGVCCEPDLVENPVGIFTPISDGVKMAKANPKLLDRILKLITELQWGEDAYGAKSIRAVKSLYAYYEDRAEEMEKVLLENCKGNGFYAVNLKWRQAESNFDFLSGIVSREMKVTSISKGKKKSNKAEKSA